MNYKIILYTIVLLFGINSSTLLFSQIDPYSTNDNDYISPPEEKLKAGTNDTSYHGEIFTPRGALKILIVHVTFKDHTADADNQHWPADQDMPVWGTDDSFLFNELNDFNNIPSENKSLSRYYYTMTNQLSSNERFKLYGNSVSVTIDPDTSKIDPDDSGNAWYALNDLVLDSLGKKYNNSFLQNYDNRLNGSSWTDRSNNSSPDGIVDYLVINYRYSGQWYDSIPSKNKEPIYGLRNESGGQGGFSGISSKDYGAIEVKYGFTGTNGIRPKVKLSKLRRFEQNT